MSLAAVVLMTSCSKIVEKPQEIKVNPDPLTFVGGVMNADITGTFPPKKFARKGELEITPVLKYGDKEIVGEPEMYVGEKAKVNGIPVSYKKGRQIHAEMCFPLYPGHGR